MLACFCMSVRARRSAPHGVGAGERDDELVGPRIDPQRRLCRIRRDVALVEPERGGKLGAGSGAGAMLRRVRRERPPIAFRRHRNHAGAHLERYRVARVGERADDMRRAERRVAGERHFEGRREDAHVRGRRRRRQDERGLREVELQRQRLHRRVVEPARVLEDAQRVAGEHGFGEDVDDSVTVRWHGRTSGLGRGRHAAARARAAVSSSCASARKASPSMAEGATTSASP